MIQSILTAILLGHVAAGFIGLAAFWVPVFTRKGGVAHRRFGQVFAWCAYIVTLSAVTTCIGRVMQYQRAGVSVTAHPDQYVLAAFLGYLGITTFASVHHAVQVVRTRSAPERIRTTSHYALAWTSIAASVAIVALAFVVKNEASIVLFALSPIGVVVGTDIRRFLARAGSDRMAWLFGHMRAMIGGGIAFHTAFAVFGSQRLFSYSLRGPLAILPWILPTLIGTPAMFLAQRYYCRRQPVSDGRATHGGVSSLP
jgi:hypothetical protein